MREFIGNVIIWMMLSIVGGIGGAFIGGLIGQKVAVSYFDSSGTEFEPLYEHKPGTESGQPFIHFAFWLITVFGCIVGFIVGGFLGSKLALWIVGLKKPPDQPPSEPSHDGWWPHDWWPPG